MLRRVSGSLLFLVTLIAALIAMTPLEFAIKLANVASAGVTYDRAVGTIWRGSLTDVAVGRQRIGQVDLRFRPGEILSRGSATLEVAFAGEVGVGKGRLRVFPSRRAAIEDLLADINLQALAYLDPRLRQQPSQMNLTIRRLELAADGACLQADGDINSNILEAVSSRWGWDGPLMNGTMACDSKHLVVSMANADGPDLVTARGAFDAVSRRALGYDIQARVETRNPRLADVLVGLQFEIGDAEGVYQYSISTMPEDRIAAAPEDRKERVSGG